MKSSLILSSLICFNLSAFFNQDKPTLVDQPSNINGTDPLPSARWATNHHWNVFFVGEALAVKPITNQLAITKNEPTAAASDIWEANFFLNKFRPGYRLTFGVNTSHDEWEVLGVYTHFTYNHSNSLFSEVSTTATLDGTTKYDYEFNQGDFDWGRMSRISSHLIMRPHLGVKAVWLNQINLRRGKYVTQGPEVLFNNEYKLKSTLIGLQGGLDTIWMLTKNAGIYGNFTYKALVNSQKLLASETDVGGTQINQYFTNYGSKIVDGCDFAIGIRWDKNFSDDEYHVGINLGYEHHSFINMNTYAYTVDLNDILFTSLYPFADQDFTYQAATIGLRFDF